ncbi:MAG: potassium channel family protein, partial [Bacillota bacterium]
AQTLSEELERVVTGDATDIEVLRGLGARAFDSAIVSVGASLESSVLITLNLKELGLNKVVAKAFSDLHRRILLKVGADIVVFPEKEAAAKVAEGLVSENILDIMDLGADCRIVEMLAGDMAGKTLGQLRLRQDYGINVIAVKRDGLVDLSPQADRRIEAGDVLVVIGPSPAVRRLRHPG